MSRMRADSNAPCNASPSAPASSHHAAGNPSVSAFSATPSVADAPSIVAISVKNTVHAPHRCPAAT